MPRHVPPDGLRAGFVVRGKPIGPSPAARRANEFCKVFFSKRVMSNTKELAKSFEPAGIEERWYPVWEQRGYFDAGLDPSIH